ncbi:GNAT family N-acetyltransferase [Chitinibacter tainanensis]|uniref:GNAT family N-acetyltransferase n=1 Tax=Chitinibacter tainanensis TaxID=230667 RepID=UPI000416F0F7|nr:GNAT family N-acetyltransferase [Chitinibacter tainanensis]
MLSSLTTARLVLRRFSLADLDAMLALTAQAEILAVLPDWAMSRPQLTDYLSWWIAHYAEFDPQAPEWLAAICLRDSGELIGWLGIWPKIGLNETGPEIAYALSPAHWGQGLMAEAVRAFTQAIFAQCPHLPAVLAIVKDWNQGSLRVVQKAGFISRGEVTLDDGEPFTFWRLPRPDLLAWPLQLRRATQADVRELAAMQTAAYVEHAKRWGPWNALDNPAAGPGGYNSAEMIRYLIEAAQYWVVSLGEVLVGGVCVEGPFARDISINWFFIDPAFGRKGLGQHVLQLLEAQYPTAQSWSLGTSAASADNARFYQRCGYQETDCSGGYRYFRKEVAAAVPEAPSQPHGFLGEYRPELHVVDCGWPDLQIVNSSIERARLHNVNATGLRIGDARLAGLEICHASWGGAHLHDLALGWHGDVQPVRLSRVDLSGARLEDCDWQGAQIQGGQLDGLVIEGVPYAELRAAWLAQQR